MYKQKASKKRVLQWVVGGLFSVLGVFFWMADLQAAGIVGTGTSASCTQLALTTALAGGGTVTFNCGGTLATIPVTSQIPITQDTVIEGGNLVKIDGGLVTRFFDIPGSSTSLTLNDIILASAYSEGSGGGNGGAIRSAGTLTLNNVTVQFCQTKGYGGAVYSSGPLIVSNSTFNENTSTSSGGAIYSEGTLTVSQSTFDKNTGVLAGGAICTGVPPTNRLQVSNSTFSNNKTTDAVTGYGGAIFVSGPIAEATIIDSLFLSNSAKLGGGLTVWTDGTATLSTHNPGSPNTFIGNSATQDGGAIYNVGTLSIYGAGLNDNTAPQGTGGIGHGGAIANTGNLTLYDSQLTLNKGRFGGALFVGIIPSAQADVRRTFFDGNDAKEFGGGLCAGDALFNTGATVTVTDSVFRNNTAEVSGGGVYRFNALLNISNSSFTDNVSLLGTGGGLYSGASVPDPTSVNATSVTFGGNTAGSGQGGGIYTTGNSVLKNLTIKDNTNGLFNAGNFVTTHLGNSVLDNLGNPGFLNCDGGGRPISLDGHNLSTDNSCAVETNLTYLPSLVLG